MAAAAPSDSSLFRSSENDPRKKFFHHESVTVHFSPPATVGETVTGSIPFGPPVIHADPEKTLPILSTLPNTDSIEHTNYYHQQRKFNIGSNRIYVDDPIIFEDDDEVAVDQEMEISEQKEEQEIGDDYSASTICHPFY